MMLERFSYTLTQQQQDIVIYFLNVPMSVVWMSWRKRHC